MDERVSGWRRPAKRLNRLQNLCKLTGKNQQTQARATGSGRLRGLSGDNGREDGRRGRQILNPDRPPTLSRTIFRFLAGQASR
ncbi:MAG: hypothetical protein J0I79_33685 [Mesorhizobium sp.]|uniref:hypothetical protein n=1 Tax=Mesorhizobium sp. TaxID=1871066 RepID=UPI001AD2C76B|nr:hypothetical protein [Mesorhizobium sp.]MBN9222910.1 hypothetical protein [Mesorhizobium sp.]